MSASPRTVLNRVETVLDRLIEVSDRHDGLFPSILDRKRGEMPESLPANVPGQRDGDRAPRGCNLMHDQSILKTMYALDETGERPTAPVTSDSGYADAADRYLETFATRCTDTVTGLFPWGEHAYWDLDENQVGDSYAIRDADRYRPLHDHLRLTPQWLWERITDHNPAAVHDYADGLSYHWNDPLKPEYIRHAPITVKDREKSGQRSCDFPRHGGYYINDWAFAYTRQHHPDYLRRIEVMLNYWWEKLDPAHQGLLRFESRGRSDELSPRQTLGLAVGLLDAVDTLADSGLAPALRTRMRERATVYLDGFLAAPHEPERDVYLGTCREEDLENGTFELRTGPDVTYEIRPMAIWGDVYSGVLAASMALLCVSAHRYTGDRRLLEWAEAVGETYAEISFPKRGTVDPQAANAVLNPSTERTMDRDDEIPIHARDVGLTLGLFADLYAVTAEDRWLDEALVLAGRALDVYLDADLPRGAAEIDRYENQLGTGFLLHGLARTALLALEGDDCLLGPDYTER